MKPASPTDARRRSLLIAAGAMMATRCGVAAAAHDEPGRVLPPRDIADLTLTLEDGTLTSLRKLLTGRVTALQFVLTSCSATCPILGAIFAQMQEQLAIDRSSAVQLVSLSLDPLGDTPKALEQWRKRFNAGPGWRAALPRIQQAALVDLLVGLGVDGQTDRDRHTDVVLIFDRQARLIFRSEALPDSQFIARTLKRLAEIS